jgi:hypothetical protein
VLIAAVSARPPAVSDGTKTLVYLLDGVPIFAEEGSLGETLGRLLIRQRVITQEQYVQIIGKMTEALVLNEQLRFDHTNPDCRLAQPNFGC